MSQSKLLSFRSLGTGKLEMTEPRSAFRFRAPEGRYSVNGPELGMQNGKADGP